MNTSCAYRKPIARPAYIGWQCVERSSDCTCERKKTERKLKDVSIKRKKKRHLITNIACTVGVIIAALLFTIAFMWVGLDMHIPESEETAVVEASYDTYSHENSDLSYDMILQK